ncbi:hypothetical protein PGT21_037152 [Puccinia graminis f. sp. tritici]|uniref:Uncharacterized protein n=1 Tax=Puccinia graminis f. sp. tritici TaxID=56615 RepID=A0A5B0R3H1_PUCGR|nr:hypothetical protein PGT21_037152 [Puccinia graminis f. sp. tritici]
MARLPVAEFSPLEPHPKSSRSRTFVGGNQRRSYEHRSGRHPLNFGILEATKRDIEFRDHVESVFAAGAIFVKLNPFQLSPDYSRQTTPRSSSATELSFWANPSPSPRRST